MAALNLTLFPNLQKYPLTLNYLKYFFSNVLFFCKSNKSSKIPTLIMSNLSMIIAVRWHSSVSKIILHFNLTIPGKTYAKWTFHFSHKSALNYTTILKCSFINILRIYNSNISRSLILLFSTIIKTKWK